MRGLLAVEAAGAAASSASASVLNGAVDWWRDVNESPLWQDRIFHALAVLYGFVSVVALVSTIPRPLRCPDPRLVRSIITARSDSDGIFCRFRLAFGSIARFFKICGRAILRDPRNLWDGLREGGTVTSAENSEFAVFNFSCRSN
jgi:hypothetical protein